MPEPILRADDAAMSQVWQALIDARLAPASSEAPPGVSLSRDGSDLLPSLLEAWRIAAGGGRGAASATGHVARLAERRAAGACLTCGWPGGRGDRLAGWLGWRFAWWPDGLPAGRTLGLVSSRLGRQLDQRRAWFAALRTACLRLDPQSDLLVTAEGVAAQRFVRRAAQLFDLPVLCIVAEKDRDSAWRAWGRRILERDPVDADAGRTVLLSPPLPDGGLISPGSNQAAEPRIQLPVPPTDAAVVAASDRLIALFVRPGGNLDRLLEERLRDAAFAPASAFVALGEGLSDRAVAARLMDRGAVGWYLSPAPGSVQEDAGDPWGGTTARRPRGAAILAELPGEHLPSAEIAPAAAEWLTHCTRRRHGPWPDQTEDDFLAALILDRDGGDHSALATLWRIAASRRLIATRDLVRGTVPAVSLTAAPLAELSRLRAYRSHLGRWDFEPYGISIRRSWLEQRGARPVRYGDESLWERLAAGERPFFQQARSASDSGRVQDWTVEREWRHLGDLDLRPLSPCDAFLFVPARAEAERLAEISPWPIALLPGMPA